MITTRDAVTATALWRGRDTSTFRDKCFPTSLLEFTSIDYWTMYNPNRYPIITLTV